MLCSVVVPLYNKEHYIEVAIRSVLQQTWQNFEIVVVDDGGTDASVDIVKSIGDPRIRFIHQKNAGVARARNRGIEEARGELICFLDGDDWYDHHYLQTVVAMAQQYPEGSFYATNFRYVLNYQQQDWNKIQTAQPAFTIIDDFYQARFRSGTIFCTNTVAVKKSDLMALQHCFPAGESLGEDQDLWFRLSERLQLVYCPEKLAAYRNDISDSLCGSLKSVTLLPVFIRLEQRVRQGQLSPKIRASALELLAYERTSVARNFIVEGNRLAAVGALIQARRAVIRRRWWVTLFMCLFGSATMLQNLEKRRDRRFA